jgi:hypothetical protein
MSVSPKVSFAQAQSRTITSGLPSFVTSATCSEIGMPPAYGMKIAQERLKGSDFADFVTVVYGEGPEVTS